MTTQYTLYSYWRSSASWRVRIALAHKAIPFELVTVGITKERGEAQKTDEYRAKNPSAQVPTLEIAPGKFIGQSLAILEYLEEQHPEPALLPKDPYLRARARQLAEIVNSGIQPFQNLEPTAMLKERGLDDRAFTKHFIAAGLGALERAAKETAGAFLVGDAPSFADACLVPQLSTSRRFEVPLEGYPTLLRAEQSCAALEAWNAARAENQPDAQK